MSRPASKEKIVTEKSNAKIKSVSKDESFLRKPNQSQEQTASKLRLIARDLAVWSVRGPQLTGTLGA